MAHWWASLSDVSSMTTVTVYVVVFTLVFVESGLLVGFFLPGDSVLFAAGLLAAEPASDLNLAFLAGGTAVAAIAGDAVGYWTGRRLGRPWLLSKAGKNADRVLKAEAFYERWGSLAVIIARFIPWVRTFTPIIAGIGRMPYPKFLVANVAGALIWGAGMILLGYAAYNIPWVKWAAYVIAAIAITATIVTLVVDRRRMRRKAALEA
ncbi:DedA family protein [Kineosporia babensis]|uniref:DedA family protein n=1 Tax=Kineosporia babensis TaxID=499548 RepID=A0A9X1N9G2_9ACTN|nr:DedA family protein [Kineosporia babensis]MCD5309719.1 DedA family protein [Kineosporia babensis]